MSPDTGTRNEPTMLSHSAPVRRPPKRLKNICCFSPLPCIVASPICTPICDDAFLSAVRTQSDSSSSCSSSRVVLPSLTPTWIATPPTPPSKNVRRSHTISARRSTSKAFSPSASFPASMQPHAAQNKNMGLRRSNSLPTFSPRLRPLYCIPTNFMGRDICQSPEAISVENPIDVTLFNGVGGPEARKDYAGSYTKPIFHLPNDSGDEDLIVLGTGAYSHEEQNIDGSWSDHSTEDVYESEWNKDALRKYYALKELLATEVGYLTDLRALVAVYLRNLPTLATRALTTSSTFGRASSSFTTGPWIHSYTQLQATALSSSPNLPETQNLPPFASNVVKESPTKTSPRYLFSDTDIEALTRNGEEILQLHDHFVKELRSILQPLDITMEHDEDDHALDHLGKVDAAIRAVSTKFATEASRFNAYQSFCAGHPEAMDVIRKAYQNFPMELDAFEHRCATMVSDTLEAGIKCAASEPKSSSPDSDYPVNQSENLTADDWKRSLSSTSLDGAVRTLPHRPSILTAKDLVIFPSETRREKTNPRIAFTDYMIKPIQRICKYPLLLDQLLPSKTLRTLPQNADTRSDVDVVVESAAQAMRHVAISVDEARHRQDIAIQSTLIFSRICLTPISPSTSPSVQALSLEFFSSLGNCLLAGSLDGMYYHSDRPLDQTSSIKAKYFGAFLYSGGYLVLVKLSKGRKYEPKHWFSLADFEVVAEGCWLPCSFRLSSGEQHFELAAACEREKDTWLSSIQKSLTHVPTWVNEPTPSFKLDDKGVLLPEPSPDSEEEPIIHSIPEASRTESPEPFFASLHSQTRSSMRKKRPGFEIPLNYRQEISALPSRRSSSNSVKAIFSPMTSDPETLLIRRSSPAARLQVEQELHDVISQSILTARSYAFSHEVELFQAPGATKSGFSRSNSGIGMAGMARLSKHESVRVPRRRTTESMDSLLSRGTLPRHTSRSNLKKLSIASIEYDGSSLSVSQDSEVVPCPCPPSQSSASRIASLRTPDSSLRSSIHHRTPATPLVASEKSSLKTRSFVRNVRDIFQLRPMTAVPVPSSVSTHHLSPYNMLHRWTKDSLRRRARSVSSEPDDSTFDDPEKIHHFTPLRTHTPLPT